MSISTVEAIQRAKDLRASMKKMRNDIEWMTHHLSVKKKTLEQKIKLRAELDVEIPDLQRRIQQTEVTIDKNSKFVVENEPKLENAAEAEKIAATIDKLQKQLEKMRLNLADQQPKPPAPPQRDSLINKINI